VKTTNRKLTLITTVLVTAVVFSTVPALALFDSGLGSLIKLFGIGYVVNQFGSEINDVINTVTFQNDLEMREYTKVVPIISGELSTKGGVGGYIGAAQVSGPKELVEQVAAVAQVEADWQKVMRLTVLIPVDNINPLEMKRVNGVGVSAVIDVYL
jgi:hypothetical protein